MSFIILRSENSLGFAISWECRWIKALWITIGSVRKQWMMEVVVSCLSALNWRARTEVIPTLKTGTTGKVLQSAIGVNNAHTNWYYLGWKWANLTIDLFQLVGLLTTDVHFSWYSLSRVNISLIQVNIKSNINSKVAYLCLKVNTVKSVSYFHL